jgi:hypothetical protein
VRPWGNPRTMLPLLERTHRDNDTRGSRYVGDGPPVHRFEASFVANHHGFRLEWGRNVVWTLVFYRRLP